MHRGRIRPGTIGVVLLLSSWMAGMAETGNWEPSYRSALKKAAEERKPILLSFHAEWCGWCEVMDREVFENATIKDRLETYVCAKIDIEKDRRTALAFEVTSVPRTILINTRSQVIADSLGYVDPQAFARTLDAAAPDLDRELPGAAGVPRTDEPDVREVVGRLRLVPQAAALPEPVLVYLSHPDPDIRQETRDALAQYPEAVAAGLVEALSSDYLGTRISAYRLLRRVTDQALPFDPWAPSEERAAAQRAWQDSLAGDE